MEPRFWQAPAAAACILLTLIVWSPANAQATPERIVSKRVRVLPAERYQELRSEWKAYADAHPGDPRGWTELARAARFSGAPCEEYLPYAEKAHRLAPDDADACATLGAFKAFVECGADPGDPREAIRLLERARQLDPDLEAPRLTLWVLHFTAGRHDEAEEDLREQLARGLFPDPLADFGHNLLVGLEPNAILLTNGDNDTYPALALQAGRGFRTDVAVVNIPLLNTPRYRREIRNGRSAVPVPLLEGETSDWPAGRAVAGLVENLSKDGWKRPLYLAVTVDTAQIPIMNELALEGLVYRVLPRHGREPRIERTRLARNLDELYRMESATSLGLNWEAWSSLRHLALNYAVVQGRLARAEALARDITGARGRMARALELCEFHGGRNCGSRLADEWTRWDPDSPLPTRWKERFDR